jgi:putative ABC transport system ATP-binding protein
MEHIVQIDHLNYSFGMDELSIRVLQDVNLVLKAGEIVILTGPSGSGKTTLLTLVGALRSGQSGCLKVLGRELIGANEETLMRTRRNIGYIFQAQNLHRSLTARQNVLMGLEVHDRYSRSEMCAIADQMLKNVGLADRAQHFPSQLSGGQKQRVSIARALASSPSLVLADEPTASLDGQSGREVVDLMFNLAKQQGTTILLVTHDPRILDVADRIVKIEDGHLHE